MRARTFRLVVLAPTLTIASCGGAPSEPAPPDASSTTALVVTNARVDFGTPPGPIADIAVFVSDAQGAVRSLTRTGTDGRVAVEVSPGDAITAIYAHPPFNNRTLLRTVLGVEPGDVIVFGDSFAAAPEQPASMTVAWPALATVDHFDVWSGCGFSNSASGAATALDLNFSRVCADPDFMVVAMAAGVRLAGGGPPDSVVAASYRGAVPFAPGASVDMPAFESVQAFDYVVTGVPVDLVQGHLNVSTLLSPIQVGPGRGEYLTLAGGAASGSVLVPPAPRGREVQFWARAAPDMAEHHIRMCTTTSGALFDGAILLPTIANFTTDFPSQTVRWITGAGAGPDAAVVRINWRRQPMECSLQGAETVAYDWQLLAPAGGDSVRFPDVPAALQEYSPQLADCPGYTSVVIWDAEGLESYDAVRTLPEWQHRDPRCNVEPGLGAIVLSMPGVL